MTLELVDVHCHVHGADFDADRVEVLARARDAGVRLVLAMGEGSEDNERVLALADAEPMLLPCLGLHPDRAAIEPVEVVEQQIRHRAARLAAIGEVGLDFGPGQSEEERGRQRTALERLTALALELDLPLSVHSRSAGHQTIELLQRCGARRVCLHAFDGSAKHAARGAVAGYLFSIAPSIVRSDQKRKLVEKLPLETLLLETDSPVLGPERAARNEPANVVRAAQTIAELKGCSLEEVARVTTENARRLFRLERFARS